MVSRVGVSFHNQASSNLSSKQGLQVAARFIQGGPEAAKIAIARAKADNQANILVHEAIQGLQRSGRMISHDLDFLGAILDQVGQALQNKEPAGSELRLALFDRAWKASAGKGKIAILVKPEVGSNGRTRNATMALKSALRHKFERDAGAASTGAKLAALLNDVKNCPTPPGEAHPSASELMNVFSRHYDALSSSALWAGKAVTSRSEYFGPPLSLLELERISNKETPITVNDVAALLATLKESDNVGKDERKAFDDMLAGAGSKVEETKDEGSAPTIDLSASASKAEILLQMSKVVAEHYRETLNLQPNEIDALDDAIKTAQDCGTVATALRNACCQALNNTKLSRDQIAEAIGRAMTVFLDKREDRWNGATFEDVQAACKALKDNLEKSMNLIPEHKREYNLPQRFEGHELLRFMANHRKVFSAPIWNEPNHETMKNRLAFARACDELGELLKQQAFTRDSIKPLLAIMKTPVHDEPVIDLDQSPENIRIALVDAVFNRFVTRQSAAFRNPQEFPQRYNTASRTADSLRVALLSAFQSFTEQNRLEHIALIAELDSLRREVETDTKGKNLQN